VDYLAPLQTFKNTFFLTGNKNNGKVLDTGLWALCRHPNYFGESLFWWGTYIVNYSAGRIWTIVCPLVFTLMVVYVTGVPVVEKQMREELGSQYEEYIKRVPKFIPLPFLGGNKITDKGEGEKGAPENFSKEKGQQNNKKIH